MKALKKITFFLFLLSNFLGYSQNTPTVTSAQDWNSSRSNKTSSTSRVSNTNNNNTFKEKDISKNINIGFAYGLSVPSSSFKNNTYAGNGSYFELSSAYYFSKIGLGLSIGQISNPTDNNFSDFTENLGFSILNNSENIKSTYVGIGPEYKLKLNKFETTFQIKAGMYTIKSFAIKSDNIENPDVTIPVLNLNSDNTKTLGFVSTGVKFDYNINHNLSVFVSAGYLTTLSGQLALTERKVEDINNNGVIDQEDFKRADGSIKYSITEKNTPISSLNLSFGVSYHFNLSTKAQDWNSSRSNKTSSTSRVNDNNNTPASTKAQDWNSSRSNKTSSTSRVSDDNNTPTSTKAQDWNSSRSNKTSSTSRVSDDNNTPTSTKAQDWNSSRSNKTSSAAPVDNNDNNAPTSTKAQDWNSSRSNKTSRKSNPNGNNQSQAAKKNCFKSGNIFWKNTDGSYSCKTTITKSQKSIKIPRALANDLATAKKIVLGDKTQQGIIEITVIHPNKNKVIKVSIPRQRVQDTETILQHLLKSTQGNGDDNGKVRIKLVAKI